MKFSLRKLIAPVYFFLDDMLNLIKEMKYGRSQLIIKDENIKYDDVIDLQAKKVIDILQYCFLYVPYYRSLMLNLGIKSTDQITFKTLFKLPPLTKALIKDNFDQLISENSPSKYRIKNSTSGSTGKPMYFETDKKSMLVRKKIVRRNLKWLGIERGNAIAWLWGAAMDNNFSRFQKIKLYVENKLFMPTGQMSDQDLSLYIRQIKAHKTEALVSYPSSLYTFAKYCEDKNVQFPFLKAILVSAETLYPYQKQLIEKVFTVPVFNRYGCREVGDIAHETRDGDGLQINADHVYLEVVDKHLNNINEQTGELLVTDLDNYGMPLIRYQIGDSGIIADKATDSSYPVLKEIVGRSLDTIICANGNRLGGTYWTIMVREKKGVEQFKVIQNSLDSISIKYIFTGEEEEETLWKEYVSQSVMSACGKETRLDFIKVTQFDIPKNGKFRIVERNC